MAATVRPEKRTYKTGYNAKQKAEEKRELVITKLQQYEFYKSIALEGGSDIPWNVRMQAFEKLCELCGTPTETARKWVIELVSK